MYLTEVYLGLGGNIGDSSAILKKAIEKIAMLPNIQQLKISRFYRTTPVSIIPQEDYINAVCRFHTSFSAHELLEQLQAIEKSLGKKEKLKGAPRVIDIDILFYGTATVDEPDLQIPHPHWSERLFVIAPLADLTHQLLIPDPKNPQSLVEFDVQRYLRDFPNIHQETVIPL